MRQTLKIYLCGLIFLIVGKLYALDLTKINLEYHYDVNALVRFEFRVVQNDSSMILFCKTKTQVNKQYGTMLLLQNAYNTEAHDTLSSYTVDTLFSEPKKNMVRLKFDREVKGKLLIIAFSDPSGGDLFFDIPLFSPLGYPDFYPINEDSLPIISNYVSNTGVQFHGASNTTFHVYEYDQEFLGADPPMGAMKPLSPTLSIDSSYVFNKGLDSLEQDHFYLFQGDSLDQTGITLLKVPFYFPKTKKLDDLLGPLQYITTSEENKSLHQPFSNPKISFEKFWINTYGTKFRAKGAIRSFYNMVQESNELFTDYKAGWKTDRGMIYIVYGKPDFVTRDKGIEIWKYTSGIEFEFIRISTLFAPLIYSLKRDIKYENQWYDRVGEIRNG
ncbi:GWxTD domain-containing protein [Marinoscillum sp. MHG1-6]|uniref:GWxTD domain-containing protein n=1 Tax=Marinoscillum sp. MHG1-6 TaxID=2959627 RepID=UPI0021581D44|nr:GWxTD domain-containing protein [Marinoscillum sp. MHG1-6]